MTEDEMLKDLATADAAGDKQLADTIAARIRSARTGAAPAAPTVDPRSPAASSSLTAAPPEAPPKPISSIPGQLWDMTRNPLSTFRDIGQGGVDAAQNMVLGARQAAAGIAGIGDAEALKKEAAAREAELKTRSPVAKTAKVVTDIGTSLLPSKWAGDTLAMIPQLPKYLEAVKAVLPSTVSGATMDLLDPSKDYDAGKKASWGGAIGAGLDTVARVPGAVYRKWFTGGASDVAKEAADVLAKGGMPKPIAATQTDAPMVQQLSDVASKLPFGGGIREARDANLDWGNKLVTKQAGMGPSGQGVTQMTEAAKDANQNRLNDAINMFRQGPDVPLPHVAPDLQAALDKVESYVKATAQESKTKPVQAAIEGATPTPSTLIMPPGVPPPPRPPVTITANEAVDRRRAASQLANAEFTKVGGDTNLAQQYRNIRDSYDNAIKDTLPFGPQLPTNDLSIIPHTAEGFDMWRKQASAHKDAVAAADKGLERGRLIPQNVQDVISKSGGVQDIAPTVKAAATNITRPTTGVNRALMTSVLLGTPLGTGAIGGLASGDLGVGGAVGLGTAAALIKGLSHTPSTPAQREAFRKMLVAAGIGIGT